MYNGIFTSTYVCIYIICCSPFIVFTLARRYKEGSEIKFSKISLIILLLINGLCAYVVLGTNNRVKAKIESYILKGEIKREREFFEEGQDDEGSIIKAHYETHYSFELAQGQPKLYLSIVEWIIKIYVIVNLYFIYLAYDNFPRIIPERKKYFKII